MNYDKLDRYGRVYDQETMKTLIEDVLGELDHPIQ